MDTKNPTVAAEEQAKLLAKKESPEEEVTRPGPSDAEAAPVAAPAVDQRTPEQKALDTRDAAAWLADPENRKKALLLAQQLASVMGKNWFTLRAFVKRTRETRQSGFAKLAVLGRFGFLARKGEGPDQLFRVLVSVADRLAVLRMFEAEHVGQLKELRHEIARCELELAAAPGQSPA